MCGPLRIEISGMCRDTTVITAWRAAHSCGAGTSNGSLMSNSSASATPSSPPVILIHANIEETMMASTRTSSTYCTKPVSVRETAGAIVAGSSSWVGLGKGRTEPFAAHVRVHLGRRERGMPEELLDGAQVRTALEQVGGHGVPQPVWPDVGRPVDQPDGTVNDASHDPLVDAIAETLAEEQRRPRARGHELSSSRAPAVEGPARGRPDRYDPLLVALAQDTYGLARVVYRADIQSAQLRHPDATRVQQLEDRDIAHPACRVVLAGHRDRSPEHLERLRLAERLGQPLRRSWRSERQRWVGRQQALGVGPGEAAPVSYTHLTLPTIYSV